MICLFLLLCAICLFLLLCVICLFLLLCVICLFLLLCVICLYLLLCVICLFLLLCVICLFLLLLVLRWRPANAELHLLSCKCCSRSTCTVLERKMINKSTTKREQSCGKQNEYENTRTETRAPRSSMRPSPAREIVAHKRLCASRRIQTQKYTNTPIPTHALPNPLSLPINNENKIKLLANGSSYLIRQEPNKHRYRHTATSNQQCSLEK